jgi:hypothetical protein
VCHRPQIGANIYCFTATGLKLTRNNYIDYVPGEVWTCKF